MTVFCLYIGERDIDKCSTYSIFYKKNLVKKVYISHNGNHNLTINTCKFSYVHVGWNDGSFNEFQTNWDEQIVIPGGVLPGGGSDYDKDPNGVDCYSCGFCQVEPFDVEASGVGTEASCHVCSKEWDDGIAYCHFFSY